MITHTYTGVSGGAAKGYLIIQATTDMNDRREIIITPDECRRLIMDLERELEVAS